MYIQSDLYIKPFEECNSCRGNCSKLTKGWGNVGRNLVTEKCSLLVCSSVKMTIIDHPPSGVVHNFCHVCQTITFESLDVGSSYLHIYLQGVRVRFVYEGHRVKGKVTGARKT